MKKYLLVPLILLLCNALTVRAQEITGGWSGSLNLPTQKLGIIFHITTDDAGTKTCKMDVPAQGAKDIPTEIKYNNGDSIMIAISAIGAQYSGKKGDGIIRGHFTQAGYTFPLDLNPISPEETKVNRPQTPIAPFPYTTEAVTFANEKDSVTLSGTLTYPEGYKREAKYPIVLFVSGSGAQDRNEEIFEHRPFAVIADFLARHGIASLRYDDRGVGESTGTFQGSTTEDFANDARAGLVYLRSLNRFSQVGVIGHSEGGLIAFMLGAESKADFLVTLAGPGVRGDSILVEQYNKALELQGVTQRVTKEVVVAQFKSRNDPWMNFFLDYDPVPSIRSTRIPVLALNGTKDSQVIEKSNLGSIQKNLPTNPKNLTKSYPGLNHLFQHAVTGAATEYYDIEETISTEVLDDIARWIKSL